MTPSVIAINYYLSYKYNFIEKNLHFYFISLVENFKGIFAYQSVVYLVRKNNIYIIILTSKWWLICNCLDYHIHDAERGHPAL